MAKPTYTISKINPNGTTYTICPTVMTDEVGTYQATLPTLTKDEIIATKSDIDAIGSPMIFKGTATVTKSGSSYTVSVATPSLASVKDGYTYKITTAPENDNNFKVGDTLIANKNNPGSNPQANWSLIPSGDDAGSILDVEVDGHSVVTNGIAEIATNSTYSATDNKIATMTDVNNVAIPEITITAAQMISSNVAQLTNEQYDILNNTKIVKIITPDSSYMNLSKEFAPNNFFLGDEGETVNDYLYFDGIKNNYDINIEKVISYNYYVLVDKTSKYVIFISNKVPLVEKVNGKLGNVTLTPTDIGIPAYTSSEENYVLSVDNIGNLVWKAPYNGAASGS